MFSKINYTLAILVIALNLIVLPFNIITMTSSNGMSLVPYLTFINLFLIPAIMTFFKDSAKKRSILMLNIVGVVLAGIVAYFVFLMMMPYS